MTQRMEKLFVLETARAIAEDFYQTFSDPASDSRGPKFIWPDTYVRMCGDFTWLYARRDDSTLTKDVAEAVGRQVAKERAELPTWISREEFVASGATWVKATSYLGKVEVRHPDGTLLCRFSVQTDSLKEDDND